MSYQTLERFKTAMKKKILVIEDEKATRTNVVNFLDNEGFKAIGAENGRTGIALAREHLPSLIICDLLMPELDGYDVLTELQEDPNTAGIPFIFLTIAADREHIRRGMQIGADDYLTKPATSAELRAAIASRLKKQEVVVRKVTLETSSLRALEQRIDRLEQFQNTKDLLFNHLISELREGLMVSGQEIEKLKQVGNTIESDSFNRLQQEFARILASLNQVAELQNILTPDNLEILQHYNFLKRMGN